MNSVIFLDCPQETIVAARLQAEPTPHDSDSQSVASWTFGPHYPCTMVRCGRFRDSRVRIRTVSQNRAHVVPKQRRFHHPFFLPNLEQVADCHRSPDVLPSPEKEVLALGWCIPLYFPLSGGVTESLLLLGTTFRLVVKVNKTISTFSVNPYHRALLMRSIVV